MTVLGDVLKFVGEPEKITDPADEKFVTVRLNGGGAVERKIGAGKTPVAFTGYRVRPGQFVYSRIDARNGAFAIIPDHLDGAVVSKDFPIFEICEGRVLPNYLRHFFRSGRLEQAIRARSRGATNRQRIKEDEFLAFPIETPPLPEQRRIGTILDYADAIRAKRRQVLTQLDNLALSIFSRAVIGAPLLTIQSMLDSRLLLVHKDGNHGSLYPRPADFDDTGVPFLTAKTVRDDGSLDIASIDRLKHDVAAKLKIGWIRNGDVLLSHNASVGKVAIYRGELGPAIIGTSLTCFRPDGTRLTSAFLASALRDASFQRQLGHDMAQTTRNQVPITAQRKLTVSWIEPAAQQELTTLVESIEATADKARDAAQDENDLTAALQFRAFRGEL